MTGASCSAKDQEVIVLTNNVGCQTVSRSANDRYAYDEWQGNVTFRDITKKSNGAERHGSPARGQK